MDADILRMDGEDMADEIMTLRISLKASVEEIARLERDMADLSTARVDQFRREVEQLKAERDKYEKDAIYHRVKVEDLREALNTLGAELLPDGSVSLGAKTFAVVDGIRLTKE